MRPFWGGKRRVLGDLDTPERSVGRDFGAGWGLQSAHDPRGRLSAVKFLFRYPDRIGIDHDMLDAGDVADVARALELAGWDGLAFTEHPAPSGRWLTAGGHQTLDPFVALAGAATVTEHIALITYLAVVAYRNPLVLAKAAATVDRMSHGRFILGIGTGYLKSEFRAAGADFDERNALFDEALDVLPLHWSGEPFSYQGRHFVASGVQARPVPVQNPIPIWVGGNAKISRRRAAERAQGWMPLSGSAEMSAATRTPHFATPDQLAAAIREVRAMAGERDASIDIAVSYHEPGIHKIGHEVERHRDMLGRIAELGATWTVIDCDFTSATLTMDFIAGFAATYIKPTTRPPEI